MTIGILKSWDGKEGVILAGEREVIFQKEDLKSDTITASDLVFFTYIPNDETKATNVKKV